MQLIHSFGVLMLDVGTVLAETREAPPCRPQSRARSVVLRARGGGPRQAEQRTGDVVKPAEEPNWPKVIDRAQAILNRSKDLRSRST